MQCKNCGVQNQDNVSFCVQCGNQLTRLPAIQTQPVISERPSIPTPLARVIITDFDMPFFSMVNFMVKSALAAIPAIFILVMIGGAIFFMLSFCGALAFMGRR